MANDAVAVIGIGCRFPGGCHSPRAYLHFLENGGDGICDIPADRFDVDAYYDEEIGRVGKMYTRRGGFLQGGIDHFDARFFGISPREAIEMDPQHRLLLEVGWEAFERAGMTAKDTLRGSRTGVFVGLISTEYAVIPRDPAHIDPYTITGSSPNIASGRIAHTLGLTGPALSVDTACSSSLVAVHLACESLRRGECDTALAGGVNAMLSPKTFVLLCRMKALSKDGRCKTFDADANGYVRAEGCGMIVLKRLTRAIADRDYIYAVIEGSAVNHDGITSGLTVPNGLAQQKVIHQALNNARIGPEQIGYVEAHGTGTPLGDPVEVKALSDVFRGSRRRGEPLVLGGVKSSIGHLEAAAGIAGLIKAILAVESGRIPPNQHFKKQNPRMDLARIPAKVATEVTPWPVAGSRRFAGVSSFGFSGTNAHVIVGCPPSAADDPNAATSSPIQGSEPPQQLLAISARDSKALEAAVARFHLDLTHRQDHELGDFCHSANACRRHYEHRAVFAASDRGDMLAALQATPIAEGQIGSKRGKLALILGDDPRALAAAKALGDSIPRFAETLEHHTERFRDATDTPLYEALERWQQLPPRDQSLLLFCYQATLIQIWSRWGVAPAAVIGYGLGECLAAYATGLFRLEDAAAIAVMWAGLKQEPSWRPPLPSDPALRFVSLRTNGQDDFRTAAYWSHPNSAGDSTRAVENLQRQGFRFFLNIGLPPGRPSSEDCYQAECAGEHTPYADLCRHLATFFCAGFPIDWSGFDQGRVRYKLDLPTYPFQGRRFWLDPYLGQSDDPLAETAPLHLQDLSSQDEESQLIAEPPDALEPEPIDAPIDESLFRFRIGPKRLPQLAHNRNVLHVGYYLELLARAVNRRDGVPMATVVRDMAFKLVMYFGDERTRDVQLLVDQAPRDQDAPGADGGRRFRLFSQAPEKGSWSLHADGCVDVLQQAQAPHFSAEDRRQLTQRCHQRLSGEETHRMIEDQGFGPLGRSVKWVAELHRGRGELLAELREPDADEHEVHLEGLGLHPGIVDTVAQLFYFAGRKHLSDDDLFMVVAIDALTIYHNGPMGACSLHLVVEPERDSADRMVGNVQIFDEQGQVLLQAEGLRLAVIDAQRREDMARAFGGDDPERDAGDATAAEGASAILLALLHTSFADEQRRLMTEFLVEAIEQISRVPREEIDADVQLMELGIDSLIGVELKAHIDRELSMDLPLSFIYESPTLAQFADTLVKLLPDKPTGETVEWYSQPPKLDPDSWIAYHKAPRDAPFRLFCIPYGVRGASLYREWQAKLPDYIEVCPIQFPGKETRIRERPYGHIVDLVDGMEEALMPMFDKPFAFYGHSGGGFFAWRLVHRLWQRGIGSLKHLFIGGFTAPTIWPNPVTIFTKAAFRASGLSRMPTPQELAQLSEEQRQEIWNYYGELFDMVTMPDEAKRAVEPATVEEWSILESYQPDEREPVFDVPLTAIHGRGDRVVSEIEMRAWRELTTGRFQFRVLPGSHLFLHAEESQDALLDLILKEIDGTLA
ncbi:polyketide synthase [Sulfidibacter corallicola]|nr:polyketide synthase [Sulfidibacter corallicola]